MPVHHRHLLIEGELRTWDASALVTLSMLVRQLVDAGADTPPALLLEDLTKIPLLTMNTTFSSDHAFGMIGLGVMGRNLLLNLADHGFAVAGYNKTPAKLDLLNADAARITGAVVSGFGDLDAS